MSPIFWVSALAAALALSAHAGEPKRVVLDVPGMNCSLCPISVKKALERMPGVLEAKADLATKSEERRDLEPVDDGEKYRAGPDENRFG